MSKGYGLISGRPLYTEPEVVVRTGQPQDMPAVMEMARLVAQENGIVAIDETKVAWEFWPALNLDGGIVGIIGENRKKPEGFILLRIARQWYSSVPTLEERVAFVKEEFRAKKGGRARKLCEFAKNTADTLGLPLTIGILSNQRTKAKIALYTRVFGEQAGAFWLYGAKTGQVSGDPLQD